jgi:ATPase family associated with various cellular activities (AAA)
MLQIQSIMPTSMTPSVTLLEDETMPPPYKVMRRGSQELEDAIQNGLVQLSLPPPEWSSWISTPSEPSPWRVYDSCCQSCNATSGSCLSAGNDVYGPQGAESKMAVDEDDHDDTTSCDPEEQDDPGSPPPVKTSAASQEPQDNNNNNNDESVVDRSLPRFSDIIGHSAVKLRLDEVLLPLALPPTLADTILVGVRSLSASILLFGPPGCGKTQLAKAIAGEAEAAFLPVGPSDIMSKFVGESEASVRSVFDQGTNECAERLVRILRCSSVPFVSTPQTPTYPQHFV